MVQPQMSGKVNTGLMKKANTGRAGMRYISICVLLGARCPCDVPGD